MKDLKGMNRWERILEDLSRHYPRYYERITEWYPSGNKEIVIVLDDRETLVYDFYNKNFRKKYYVDETSDLFEEQWCSVFADKLDRMMRIRGVMGNDLSEETGVSIVTISKYLNAKGGIPRTDVIQKIAKVLDCSVTELIYSDDILEE